MAAMRVAVIGGSIGGLTAAVLLRSLGCDVHVYERAGTALESRGAGIVVLPMTERYFTEASDEQVSLELTWWTYVDGSGTTIAASEDNFRFGSWNGVYRSLLAEFDPARYHLDSEMVGVENRTDGAAVQLSDGTRIDADLVVCADGLASTARSLLLPGVDPTYAGYVAWRGTVPESQLSIDTLDLLADAMVYQVLDHGHILVYAIPGPGGSAAPGERIQNFVWYRNYALGGPFEALMTDTEGEQRPATVPPGFVRTEHLDELHAAGAELAPPVREVVAGSPAPFVQAIFDLEVSQMAFGRICLMGDAAFAARPHVAAGTAKAAADAWALHDHLDASNGDIDAALAGWERQQLALGRSVVERSRAMGVRSQVEATMTPGDPDWKFGLFEAGN